MMKIMIVLLSLHSLLSLSIASFTPIDNYLIACGSSKNVIYQGRTFVPDSDHSSVVVKSGDSALSTSATSHVPSPIHQSARVFASTGSFKFEIRRRGRHWIRLHFYPIQTRTKNLAEASVMSVVTDKFVLMEGFSFQGKPSLAFKEYSVNVTTDWLTLTFIPANNSVAFVNAIEVVSFPDGVIPEEAVGVNPSTLLSGLSELALETVYRVNMGGPLINPENDTLGRTWETDEKYLYVKSSALSVKIDPASIRYVTEVTPEIAPNFVYATAQTMSDSLMWDSNFKFNVTWVFDDVDPRFEYFVRAHFCDMVSRSPNDDFAFNFFINNDSALWRFDLLSIVNLNVPVYRDFVSNSSAGTRTMTVSVGPDSLTNGNRAILNGLEIMRLSNGLNSLAGDNVKECLLSPEGCVSSHPHKGLETKIKVIFAVVVTLTALPLLCFTRWWYKRRRVSCQIIKIRDQDIEGFISSNESVTAKRYRFSEVKKITKSFVHELGNGGCGKVYKGELPDGRIVAVKLLHSSKENAQEFINEVVSISKTSHVNIVKLLGFCFEGRKRALIYEFMPNGSLEKFVYNKNASQSRPNLEWGTMIDIATGIARGLEYLHRGCNTRILHFDIEPHNILLDEDLCPKVSDFGLAKLFPNKQSNVSLMNARGTMGYIAPEVCNVNFGGVSSKSDVYSYGMMILEMVGGRKNIKHEVSKTSEIYFPDWIYKQLEDEDSLILWGNMTSEENQTARKMIIVGLWCIQFSPTDRPSMSKVIEMLEGSLEALQIPTRPTFYSPRSPERLCSKQETSSLSSSTL